MENDDMDDDDMPTPTCFAWVTIFRKSALGSEVLTARNGDNSSKRKSDATAVIRKHHTFKGDVQFDNLMFSDEKATRRLSSRKESREIDHERSLSRLDEPSITNREPGDRREKMTNGMSPAKESDTHHRRTASNSIVIYNDSADLSGSPSLPTPESDNPRRSMSFSNNNIPSPSPDNSSAKKEQSVLRRMSMKFVKLPAIPGAVRIRSCPEYSSNTPMEMDKAMDENSQLRVHLRPHVHTKNCDRAERVCTAIGKWREGETVFITGLYDHPSSFDNYTPYFGIFWLRSNPPHDAITSEFHPISGSGNQIEYKLTSQDVNCFVTFSSRWVANGNSPLVNVVDIVTRFALASVGPIEASPPKISNLHVAGNAIVGSQVRAQGDYTGGVEGNSSYWWIRITPQGERVNITEPAEFRDGFDPRVYTLTTADVGSTLKVKCRPVRDDGDRGEVVTSKPSLTVRL